MTIAYPAISPTDLTLTFGRFAVNTHGWQGVWEQPIIQGNLQTDVKLNLLYRNITTADAVDILTSWRASASGLLAITSPLPAALVAGVITVSLADYIRAPQGLVWTFAERPNHEAVKAGRATVTVNLTAELR